MRMQKIIQINSGRPAVTHLSHEKTLEKVGGKFGVPRERIRQIQNMALDRLRKMIQKREAVQLAA